MWPTSHRLSAPPRQASRCGQSTGASPDSVKAATVAPLTVARANVNGEARPCHAQRLQECQEGDVGRPAYWSIREALTGEELLQVRRTVEHRRARQAAAVTALGCASTRRHPADARAVLAREKEGKGKLWDLVIALF